MIVGMVTIMLFLGLIIFCIINFAAYLTRKAAARKIEAIRKEREIQVQNRKKEHQAMTGIHADEDIAVIAAAVAAFESERSARA